MPQVTQKAQKIKPAKFISRPGVHPLATPMRL